VNEGTDNRADSPGAKTSPATAVIAVTATAAFALVLTLSRMTRGVVSLSPILDVICFAVIAVKSGQEARRRSAWPYLLLLLAVAYLIAGSAVYFWLISPRFAGRAPHALYPISHLVYPGGMVLLAAGYFAWALRSWFWPRSVDLWAAACAVSIIIVGAFALTIRLIISLSPHWYKAGTVLMFLDSSLDLAPAAVIVAGAALRTLRWRALPDFLQLGGAVILVAGAIMRALELLPGLAGFHHLISVPYGLFAPLGFPATFAVAIGFLLAAHPRPDPAPRPPPLALAPVRRSLIPTLPFPPPPGPAGEKDSGG
jgi:hypothetical protein